MWKSSSLQVRGCVCIMFVLVLLAVFLLSNGMVGGRGGEGELDGDKNGKDGLGVSPAEAEKDARRKEREQYSIEFKEADERVKQRIKERDEELRQEQERYAKMWKVIQNNMAPEHKGWDYR